jgi:SH3-like domain-containing protein
VALAACSGERDGELATATHAAYADGLRASGLDATQLGSQWLAAAALALDNPVPVELPYGEQGAFLAHRPRAEGFEFTAAEGQSLIVGVAVAPGAGARIFADLFAAAAETGAEEPPWRLLGSLEAGASELRAALPSSGRYLLRLQPELLAELAYQLRIEIEPALRFPVEESDVAAVQSYFGDPRDSGRRQHEGIDIFAPRGTPVLAVADGLAMPRTSRLGGRTVWLRGSGASYYYAHLDAVTVSAFARVATGDVLGYVGNTGNARTTASHLHFGIYRRRAGAVDPLPLLRSWRLAQASAGWDFAPHEARVTAARLNVRAAPDLAAPVLRRAEQGTWLHARAAAAEWTRVSFADGGHGWIASRYREPLDEPLYDWRLPASALLRDAPGRNSPAIARVDAGGVLEVLGIAEDYLYVRLAEGGLEAWTPQPAE